MCVIIQLLPEQNVPLDMLDNAVANNWHGYGLIIKKEGKLEVIKKVPKDFDNPDVTRDLITEIDDILRSNSEYERVIHLRHKTEGDIDLDNCHPFTVFKNKKREVLFAHNGTLYEYKPKNESRWENGNLIKPLEDKRSDSRIFAETVLQPLFEMKNDGDYTSEFFRRTVMKYWTGGPSNRGILVSNDLPTTFINVGEWKNVPVSDDTGKYTIKCSNDDYFKAVTRGPIFEEAKKKEEEKVKTTHVSVKTWNVTKLKDIDLKSASPLTAELVDIMEDVDLFTDRGTANLANLREDEIEGLVNAKPEAAASLLIHITGSFKRLYDEFLKLEEKHKAASKMVSVLKKDATIQ